MMVFILCYIFLRIVLCDSFIKEDSLDEGMGGGSERVGYGRSFLFKN